MEIERGSLVYSISGRDKGNLFLVLKRDEEFVYLAKGISADTAGKYYRVADGISAFDLSKGNLKIRRRKSKWT